MATKPKKRCVALRNGKRCRRIAKFDHMQRRGDTALKFEVRLEYPLCEECSIIVDGIDAEMNRGRAPAIKKVGRS